ncbi:hypothetical protein OXR01_09915 [Staphylococcus gallinarum]|jgi:hypothetical protein|uniref:Uncharacterized protein n=2 Tax=Staphylococcus gallinarum TaxID=1293 RepID=A0ABQ0Y577_STAGA|nr:hypothetical protein [Staphylococcus gallinarum]KIR12579.1 membrane protein [Staphylococcus gallinarum]MBU7216470.1 hypothetical protein [Staphylococcus gallinarum]MCD8785871.1 hypothetical protein [Staphylococcus gallinarum]MCD8794823.1 hypothetical protein [Staphylococcus gallinarum]MCD8829184.1 hypothetical protein [Staphylococcus gallinarum]
MINIISAIGSIGTFVMALFYFVSVSIQLYQMKISFIPALSFNQILVTREKDQLQLTNTGIDSESEQDYMKLYNLGGGAAKNIKVEIYLGDDDVLQRKYINILPSKEGYLLPINKDVYSEIENTIKNEGYDSNLNIKITYKHNVSRKEQYLHLNGKIDSFNTYNDKSVYELQFF